MSLDRLQSKQGNFIVNPEPGFTVASSLSSVASNQLNGGFQIGNVAGFLPAQVSDAGGGLFLKPYPNGTVVNSGMVVTGGTLSHFNAGYVAITATVTANNLQMQPPTAPGQMFLLHNVGATTCSVQSLATVPAFNITSATTQTCWMNPAFSIATGAKMLFIAAPHSATATSHYPGGIWMPIVSTV